MIARTVTTEMTLLDFVAFRYVPQRRILPESAKGYAVASRVFGKFLGREATLTDLTEKNLDVWLALNTKTTRFRSVRKYREILLCLLRFKSEERLGPHSTIDDYYREAFAPIFAQTMRPGKMAAYDSAISLIGEFLGRRALLSDLNNKTVAAFLGWLIEHTTGVTAVASTRDCLLNIWRFANTRNCVPTVPEVNALPKPKPAFDVPRASNPEPAVDIEAAGEAVAVGPNMMLAAYVKAFRVPAVVKSRRGVSGLHQTGIAIRWFDALLKRPPTLADLSKLTASPTKTRELIQLIIAHGRLASTAQITVERLFALWRSIVFAGHMLSNGKQRRLPAVERQRPRKPGPMQNSEIPTSGVIERDAAAVKVSLVARPKPASPATLETTLLAFLLCHYVLERPIAQSTINAGYKSAISSFDRFLGRPARLSDLTAPQINAWIVHMEGNRAPRTVSSNRRMVLTIWRFAFETEVLNEMPRRIRKVKLPRLIVEGWDTEQMGTLLRTADELAGSFPKTGIERRVWWRAFLLTAWFTGLRLGDLLRIEFSYIAQMSGGEGRLTVVMSKTGDAINRLLPVDAMHAIRACMASGKPRQQCFPLWTGRRFFHRETKLLIAAAGLTGSIKFIRRGSASEAERIKAGAGRMHLGHRTVGLFETNYRCDRIVQQEITLPPAPDFTPTLRIEHKAAGKGKVSA